MMITHSIPFRLCRLVIEPWGCRTVFADGSEAPAEPETDPARYPEAKVTAWLAQMRDMGYDDPLLANWHHEAMHTFVSEALGYPCSLVLFFAAHQPGGWYPHYREEESIVRAFHRYVRHDLDELKRQAERILDGGQRPKTDGSDVDLWINRYHDLREAVDKHYPDGAALILGLEKRWTH
jgi:hypothetical protein